MICLLMVPFEITSLYTNLPLQDTEQIGTDVLYRAHLGPALILEGLYLEFMPSAKGWVEFSIDVCSSR